jgi:hypothetical protein
VVFEGLTFSAGFTTAQDTAGRDLTQVSRHLLAAIFK